MKTRNYFLWLLGFGFFIYGMFTLFANIVIYDDALSNHKCLLYFGTGSTKTFLFGDIISPFFHFSVTKCLPPIHILA